MPSLVEAINADIASLDEREQIPMAMRGVVEHYRLLAEMLTNAYAVEDYGAAAKLSSELRQTRALLASKEVHEDNGFGIDDFLARVSTEIRNARD